jgi:(1->4)-alpha-D-glucan 1-alpha-D-glucosylmutase
VPDEAYEQAAGLFLEGVLDPDRPARVVFELHDFVQRIAVPGALNGLSQMLLRMTSPGVPDLYQGTEYWDFSLVDPDNRRAVDFFARSEALARDAAPGDLLAHWQDGQVKQAILHRALQIRARLPKLFGEGSYVPVRVEGPACDHILAFARQDGEQTVMTVISRLSATSGLTELPLIPADFWMGTYLLVPRSLHGRMIHDVLREGGAVCADEAGRLAVANILSVLPVALLEG